MLINENIKDTVSIVILNWNGLDYLRATLPVIVKSYALRHEIIVVDNGSTDGSADYIKTFPEVLVIRNKENLGYSAGKNIGVSAAKGGYVLLLDEDIVVPASLDFPGLIRSMREKNALTISFLLKDASLEKTEYYGGYYSLYGIRERKRIDCDTILNCKAEYVEVASPDGGALLVGRGDFINAGCYDSSQPYFVDVGDFGIRAAILTGKRNYLHTKKLFIHLGEQRKTDNAAWCWKFKYVLPGLTKIILKNYNAFNVIKCYPITFAFVFLKMIKQLYVRRDVRVLTAYFASIGITCMAISGIFRNRRMIQSKRIVGEDKCLSISIPDFQKI